MPLPISTASSQTMCALSSAAMRGIRISSILRLLRIGIRYAAFLSPQGRLLCHSFVLRTPGGFLIDCRREMADKLAAHMIRYKLRSQVA